MSLTALVFISRSLLFRNKTKLKPGAIDKLLAETSNFVNENGEEEELDETFWIGK